jgi:hypothetical protein
MSKTIYRFVPTLLIVAAFLSTTQFARAAAVTNWIAFNDHVPGPVPSPGVNNGWGTAANANRYNMRGLTDNPPEPIAGFLTDFNTGMPTPAYFISTATGAPDFFGSIAYPGGGTPGSNLFNGIVDLGNNNSAIGVRYSSGPAGAPYTAVTLTFSNLNPAYRYIFRGTAVRGNNYVRRWTLASLRGVDSFTNAHQGVGVYTSENFPTGTMTNGQAAYNSGENRANGAVIGWDQIAPGGDGVFTVKCEQYVDNPLPNGQTPDLTVYGYAFAGIMLAEVGEPVPVSITVQPPATINMEQNRTLTLSVTALGAPAPTYQWYKGNMAISGATSRTFSKPLAQSGDSGNYFVIVSNFVNSVTSITSVVTVTNDVTAPTVVSVASVDFTNISVCFSEKLDPGTLSETSNYTIDDGAETVDSVLIRPDGMSVVLHVSPPVGETFAFSASVSDLAGNPSDGAYSTGSVVHLTPFDLGGPLAPGNTFSCDANLIELTAGGADIWLTSDQGHVALATRSGDFDVRTRLVGLTFSDAIAKAGLMVRETSAADSRTIHLLANPLGGRNGIEMGIRSNTTSVTTTLGTLFTGANIPNTWLRLRRFDNVFSGYRSSNGVDWVLMAQTTQAYPASVLVGLAATAHNNSAPATLASFLNYGNFTYPGAAIGITQQPANIIIPENNVGALTVAAVATNTPQSELSYHWQTETTIGGNDWTNILGAINSTLGLGPVGFGDNGRRFRVVVSVPGAIVTSAVATLTVVNDTFPPTIISVRGTRGLNGVSVRFSELMNSASVSTLGNYTLTETNGTPVPILSATVGADNRSVVLGTAVQLAGTYYVLHAQNMTDLAGNALAPTNITFQNWIYSRGFVLKELYLGLSTTTVAISELRSSPNYPNSPDIVRYGDTPELNTFDEFEGYGARMSGVFIPPVSGNYTFYLSTDDNGELWMNTNGASSAGIVLIAKEPVYAGRRIWTGESAGGSRLTTPSPSGGPQANISGPITLNAGQSYYFESLVKEGGGGDNMAISWQVPGGPVPVNGSLPSGGLAFAALADPTGASINILQQPANTNIQPGETASFVVRATGTNGSGNAVIVYQWQRFIAGSWQDINGANTSNYVTGVLNAPDSGSQFRALLFIPGASATSAVATVIVGNPSPTLRYSNSGGNLVFSWDAPARLQCTTSLTPPIVWKDVTTTGVTSYTVTPSNQFNVNLDAAQAGGGGRTGTGSGTLTVSGNTLSVDVVYSGLSGNRSADHFHAPAPRGVSANVVYDLGAISTGTTSGTINGNVTLVDGQYGGKSIAAQVQDMRNSLWYLNIHTSTFGNGEIRGQVEPGGARFYRLISP